ncbi:hypothetical protein, partial [Mesorhizobium sp.]|uniref:hypothetical protein n=1 Tax=Mesorhizobium sp. TaxID=1871066 RepID=UPI0025C4ABED
LAHCDAVGEGWHPPHQQKMAWHSAVTLACPRALPQQAKRLVSRTVTDGQLCPPAHRDRRRKHGQRCENKAGRKAALALACRHDYHKSAFHLGINR